MATAFAFYRTVAESLAFKAGTAAGAVDVKSVRSHGQTVPTRIALAGIVGFIGRKSVIVRLSASIAAKAPTVIAVRPAICYRPATSKTFDGFPVLTLCALLPVLQQPRSQRFNSGFFVHHSTSLIRLSPHLHGRTTGRPQQQIHST